LFQKGFRNVGRDEARHMAITLHLFEKEAPRLSEEDKELVTKQLRAGFVFLSMILYEPPEQFWQLPPDFLPVHRELEQIARDAGWVCADDIVVFTAGLPLMEPGNTNLIKADQI